jgi:hypothetical protein
MKKLLLLILVLVSNQVYSQYHIRVECFSIGYHIVFTNDNWQTSEPLMRCVDLVEEMHDKHWLRFIRYCGEDQDELVEIAKHFKNYDSCILFNKKEKEKYDRLFKFYKKHELKCCRIKQVY